MLHASSAGPRPRAIVPAASQRSRRGAPQFLLGIDGGGTHTRARLTDVQGRLLGDGRAGPSALGQGVEQAWAHVGQALGQAAAAAGLARPDWSACALGLGLSGACVEPLRQAFLAADPGCARIVLDTDGGVALLGAHEGRPGVLLASGTGSVCEARRADGTRVTVGGWGWRTGDEGSGAWLGREALRHAQRVLDGRAAAGPLADAVQAHVGLGPQALLGWAETAHQSDLAALALLVFAQADADPAAAHLLDQAASELAALVQAADPGGHLPLALAGSVALNLQGRLPQALQERLVNPSGDALSGALSMIRSQLQEDQGP